MILLNILLTFCSGHEHHPSVSTTSFGSIDGMLHPLSSGVEVFKGIPFAQPPIGSLRWEPPQPLKPDSLSLTNSAFNATSFGSVCPQASAITGLMYGEEDCLYLNIYRPSGYTTDMAPLPVMLWIYGGGYTTGNGDIYDPLNIVLDGSVIVVTINYRLGFFGFASTLDNHLPGNYGLLDQQLAIKFTSEIISDFGGDANAITIFGESAGGGSVMLQLLSPLNQGLLQGGISQSGAVSLEPIPSRTSIFDVICNRVSSCSSPFVSSKGVQILRDASMNEIFSVLDNISTSVVPTWAPVLHDGVFFPTDVRDIISSENFTCSDFIGGWNDRDGNLLSFFNISDNPTEIEFGNSWKDVAIWMNLEWNKPQQKATYERYSKISNVGKWEDLMTDGMFMALALDFVNTFANKGCPNVYSYRYSFQGQFNFYPVKMPGAGHGDELARLFPFYDNYTQQETDIGNRMIEYWTSFARRNLTSVWPTYNPGNDILDINSGTPTFLNLDDTYSFWTGLKMLTSPTSSPTSSPISSPTMSDAINKSPLFVLSFMLMLVMLNMLEE